MRYCIRRCMTLVFGVLLFATCAVADETSIPMQESAWKPVSSNRHGAPSDSVLRLEEDLEKGPVLCIEGQTQGRWGGRYELTSPLESLRGVVRGYYRTQNIDSAYVWVRYFHEGEYVRAERIRLAPAADWTRFEFVFRRPPPGTDQARLAVGMSSQTKGTACYTCMAIAQDIPEIEFPEQPGPLTRPAAPDPFQPGKYFHIEHAGGAWWLVAPAGVPFYSVGTDGVWYREGEDHQAKDQRHVRWLRRLKANSLAGWTEISRWAPINKALLSAGETPFATFLSLETGVWWGDFDHLLDANGEPQSRNHAFPDPFDPRFEKAYRSKVREIVALVRDKPWHAAWFADNEIAHRDLYRYPYSHHCSLALRDFLQSKYDSIDALNQAWKTEYDSFDQIIESKPEPRDSSGPMRDDFHAFSREIVKQYIDVTLSIFKEEDPGRLVFSPRLMFGDTDYVDLYSRYDAVAVNHYPSNNQPGLDGDAVERLRESRPRPIAPARRPASPSTSTICRLSSARTGSSGTTSTHPNAAPTGVSSPSTTNPTSRSSTPSPEHTKRSARQSSPIPTRPSLCRRTINRLGWSPPSAPPPHLPGRRR